jgi:hypothetical protein
LAVKAVEHDFSAQFYRFDEIKLQLKADAHFPPARLRRGKYLSTALLVIDELGFEPMSRDEASLFFRLVTYRYLRGSILITTNKTGPSCWPATKPWPRPSSTVCCTKPTCSTSKGGAIDSGTWMPRSGPPGPDLAPTHNA